MAFKRESLETDRFTREKKLYDEMSEQNLRTVSSILHSKKATASGIEFILVTDNKIFGHLILVASSKNLHIREVLKHPLGSLPWSLANADGTVKKTNKSTLTRYLKKMIKLAEHVPENCAVLIGGMELV